METSDYTNPYPRVLFNRCFTVGNKNYRIVQISNDTTFIEVECKDCMGNSCWQLVQDTYTRSSVIHKIMVLVHEEHCS